RRPPRSPRFPYTTLFRSSIAYFIRDTGRTTVAGRPISALWMQSRNAGQAGVLGAAYELVEGVEDMQLEYGLDTNADGAPDEYRRSEEHTSELQSRENLVC